MKTNLNFNSAICTSREQSERLLTLGLKKETADMHYYHTIDFEGNEVWYPSIIPYENVVMASDFVGETEICLENYTIPAWSLHRLLCLLPTEYTYDTDFQQIMRDFVFGSKDMYDEVISCIGILIATGYFYSEYLEEHLCGKH